jgi:hypothetical protein
MAEQKMDTKDTQVYGIVASFENPKGLLEAAKKVRSAGYKRFDCHSPFPVHGLDDAMGLKQSKVGFIAGICGAIGFVFALWLQWWTSAVDYPLVIAGKPFFSYQAFVPVTFGLTVLFAAFGAFFGMLYVNRLPRWFHGVFYSEKFSRVVDDAFYVSIESDDPQFNREETSRFLESIGGKDIELLEGK